ncbi:DUF4062 domain-containing protein [Aequorivita sp. Q41]|uniref:DUF4062 domain-containing protein n=1 Tax=Aequorivita sp. Q41 TaxID=3153300 RepID=UPI003242CE4A
MAKPRIFISSTFFDLRQVRADLERFIKEMGYESVRNETGSIPYGKDLKLEDYCYREIIGIDILVGIIGGRFGSSSEHSNYSITQTEIKTALEQNKNVYVFIDKNVHSEYETYLINKDNNNVQYRYADDVKIYEFIEEIYSLPKNNIIQSFETAQDITSFLREQWAGLFKDLLAQEQKRENYENISTKVTELNEVSSTLKTYLESVLESVNGEHSNEVITKEKERLEQFHLAQKVFKLGYIGHLIRGHEIELDQVIDSIKTSETLKELNSKLSNIAEENTSEEDSMGCMFDKPALEDINKARKIFNLPSFEPTKKEWELINQEAKSYDIFKEKIKSLK